MNNILAFGASTSSTSINKQLASFAANLLTDCSVNLIDLNDYSMPIYNADLEKENGVPKEAKSFKELIKQADGIVISFAEHNGSYTAAFKNIFDWSSRVEKDMWQSKPMFLLATSPGARGGATVLETAINRFPFMGGQVVASFSLPSFHTNFSSEAGLHNEDLLTNLKDAASKFQAAL